MRILLVEDEAVIARRLRRLTREILGEDVERLDELGNLHDALDRVLETSYDLVLLDLHLHGEDGFELLRQVTSGAFHTVVVSAHTERALEAFELGVLDFVAKPFTRPRLEQALRRAQGQGALPRALRYLAVRRAGEVRLVPVEKVAFVRADGDYSALHTEDGDVFLHDKSLAKLDALLPERFLRIHRSYVVDLARAVRLVTEEGSRYSLVLRGGEQIPVGRTRVGEVRERLI